MPLAGPILGALITAEFTAAGLTGTQQLTLAMAVGNGIATNILATNIYQGNSVGVGTGAGVGTGTIKGITGVVTGALIYGYMLQNSLTGTQGLNLANAIGNAFATHIATGIVTSTSTPVANGVGIGQIKGVVGSGLGVSIFGFMGASALTGTQALTLANSIGSGVADSLALGIVQTSIVGAGYPPTPTSGIDIGKML